jgi:phosphoribosylanthranilate isomerase
VKELGGTGRTHNWAISARLVAAVDKPVFLAGGLDAGNVAEAVAQVRPYGLDLCSKVRTVDQLDAAKLTAFMKAAQTA